MWKLCQGARCFLCCSQRRDDEILGEEGTREEDAHEENAQEKLESLQGTAETTPLVLIATPPATSSTRGKKRTTPAVTNDVMDDCLVMHPTFVRLGDNQYGVF